jgi:Arc/MetJ family transcription regulator
MGLIDYRGSCRPTMVYQSCGTLLVMPPVTPRVQVTLDSELAAAVAEFGGSEPRSRAVRDLALRGAEAIRAEQAGRSEAREHLRRIASGEDDRYDFGVSASLHAAR